MGGKKSAPAPATPAAVTTPATPAPELGEQNRAEGRERVEAAQSPQLLSGTTPESEEELRKKSAAGSSVLTG